MDGKTTIQISLQSNIDFQVSGDYLVSLGDVKILMNGLIVEA